MMNNRLQKFLFMLCGLLLAAGHVMELNGAAEQVPDGDAVPEPIRVTYRNPPIFMPTGTAHLLNFGYRGDGRQLIVSVQLKDGETGYRIGHNMKECSFEYVAPYRAHSVPTYRVLPRGLFFYDDLSAIEGLTLNGKGLYSPTLRTCFNFEADAHDIENPDKRVFSFRSIATPFMEGYQKQEVAEGIVFVLDGLENILTDAEAPWHPFPVTMLPAVAPVAEGADPLAEAEDGSVPRAVHDQIARRPSVAAPAAAAEGAGGGVRGARRPVVEVAINGFEQVLARLERAVYSGSAPRDEDDSPWLQRVKASYQRGEGTVSFMTKYFGEKSEDDIYKLLIWLRNEIATHEFTERKYWNIQGIMSQYSLRLPPFLEAGAPVTGGGGGQEDRELLDRLTGLRGNLERLQAALGQLRDRTGS